MLRQGKYLAFMLALLLGAQDALASEIEADKTSAVIYAYQRVGEDSLPQSSISVERFKAHIEELKTDGYNVMRLADVIDSFKSGKRLPTKTVAITFDGAWNSTFTNAVPLLEEAGLPYTIFYASDMADGPASGHMSWKEVKSARKSKLADLGILPSAYAQLVNMTPEQTAAIINKAVSRYREEFGEEPRFFAYPYGEYSQSVKKQISEYSFSAAFGQHSGVAHAKSDMMALPRFTMTDAFGSLDRFTLTANALPLPVSDVVPEDMVVSYDPLAENYMAGFSVTPEIKDVSRLSCFASGMGKVRVERPGGNRIEMRLPTPFNDRTTRVNCTMPDDTVIPGQAQIWRWFGMQLIDRNFEDSPEIDQQP